MGPHCYDKERFPEGPWAKKGDWIIFARYAGSRIKIDGGEIRLLNDDEVLATVDNPEIYSTNFNHRGEKLCQTKKKKYLMSQWSI